MVSTTIAQWSYNGGEVSPRLKGRVDQALYAVSVEQCLGYVPLLQGPLVADTGTRFVEVAAGPCRLFPFEYNPTQGYVIEGVNAKFRFYTNDARIETSPGVPYEVAHPYTYAQLATLTYEQSADVLYLFGGSVAPRQLTRITATTFTLGLIDLRNGPIGDSNTDKNVTITASATTGTITLTASAASFASTDVGSLVEIEALDTGDIPSWEPGITTTLNDKRAWEGKVYKCTTSTAGQRSGTNPPIHDEGAEWDGTGTGTDINAKGPYGVKWKFLYSRIGLATITGFTSATVVSASVVKTLADSLVTTASWRWALGAFSDTRGWPSVGVVWDESLVLFKGSTGFVSTVGDLNDYDRRDSGGDFQRDLAGTFNLPGNAEVRWAKADRLLVVGTDRGEYTVERLVTQGAGAGPPVFQVKLQGSAGVAAEQPIQAAGRILFIQRARRKLLEMSYAFATDRYTAPNVARLADHITARGISEMAYAQEPAQVLWSAMDDGTMAGMTYDPDQQVMGWFRRELGGGMLAKSVARITDPAGTRDQLWIAVQTAAGAHWILRKQKPWEIGDAAATSNYLDAALSYSGAAVSAGSGAAHLAGQTVSVLADGKPHRDIVISGAGGWTLDYAASNITLGLPYPARVALLPPGVADLQDKVKRVNEVTLRFLETAGVRISVQGLTAQPLELQPATDPMDGAPTLFSGDYTLPTLGAFDRNAVITIERHQPLPSTLVATLSRCDVNG